MEYSLRSSFNRAAKELSGRSDQACIAPDAHYQEFLQRG